MITTTASFADKVKALPPAKRGFYRLGADGEPMFQGGYTEQQLGFYKEDKVWLFCHLPSGESFGASVRKMDEARELARDIQKVVDCSQSAEAVLKEMELFGGASWLARLNYRIVWSRELVALGVGKEAAAALKELVSPALVVSWIGSDDAEARIGQINEAYRSGDLSELVGEIANGQS